MKLNKQETKLHYKMYKSGKKWLISGITTTALMISIVDFAANSQASADVNQSVQSNADSSTISNSATTSDSSQASSASSNSVAASNSNQASSESSSSTNTSDSSKTSSVSSTNVTTSDSSQNSAVNSSSVQLDSLNESIQSLPSDGSYVSTDNDQTFKYVAQNDPVKGLYENNDKQLLYFNYYDGTQAKGSILNINNKDYYFDKNSGQGYQIDNITGGQYKEEQVSDGKGGQKSVYVYQNQNGDLLRGLHSIDGSLQYFDPETGIQLKGGIAEFGGAAYYFESNQGDLIGNVSQVVNDGKYVNNDGKNQYVDANNNVVKGLTSVNGNLQYFDTNTGEQAKNKQVYTNGVTYYFDNDGNGQYLFTNTSSPLTNDTIQHNVANSADPNDYKNTVDGFLTAESWYRPKDIMDNGVTWRPSTSSDYRPIITVWWPNKNVEVNYLKLMQDNGLLASQTKYSLFSDQTVLDQAAQEAQAAIEKRIKQENSTDWLNDLLFKGSIDNPSFMNKQFVWNISSEYPWQGDAWFQGGYLKYGNSDLTPNANSDYRKNDNSFDFLLANDIDNSNPVVQAENINWLYYLMNFGNITTNGQENNANFDSIRLDAVDFISNDAIQRTYDYLRDAYGLSNNDVSANKHLSLVEAGIDAGTSTINGDALIESPFRESANDSLTNGPGKNQSMVNFLKDIDAGVMIADHTNNDTDGGVPNYSIIHAHDKGIQENVGTAITDTTGANWTNFTSDQLQTGLNAYYNDQRSSNKKYNSYNVPSTYAIMLTNKGTVPRIYYGDIYQDNGQYMQNKSLYYDAISSLMYARKKYVAGGQTMSVDDNGFLKSVRFGKGAMTTNDTGTQETRNEGIGLIVGNDPSVNLKDNATVTLNMGAAHKNQKYRALMLTTKDGIQTYDSDDNAPVVETDDNGNLTFSNRDINDQANTSIHGTLNPQVSGYLAAWVPVGASEAQDARTAPSTTANTDGKVLHSNDALDSNLIYEGFSNFQPMPTTPDERTNVVIAKNAKQFSDWGVTSFEMAPQYKSTDDNSFLDSTIKNGYAFSDRYDLGFGTPTKYGTDEDLRQAIKSLHQNGMQVMADYVLNQVYNLPGQEVVSTNRTGVYGNDVSLPFGNQLYVVNTIGGGKYQEQYGGEFLNEIKEKYPDLFNSKDYKYYWKNYTNNGNGPAYLSMMNGSRSTIPSDEKIKQWSAKYMNGTNILGRGMGYVLKDWNTGTYFKINGNKTVLPSVLSSDLIYRNGWLENQDGTWSYYDANNGNRLTGNQEIDGQHVYFNSDGIQVKGNWGLNSDGSWSYYDANSGNRLIGSQDINGQHVYFNSNGVQVKGDWAPNSDGTWSYYDANSGDRLTGSQEINGQRVYFNGDGSQVKGQIATINGQMMYFDADSGDLVVNKQVTVNGIIYNANNDGILSVQSESSATSSASSSSSNSSSVSSASISSSNSSNASSASSSNSNSSNASNASSSSSNSSNATSSSSSSSNSSNASSASNSSSNSSNASSASNSNSNSSNASSASNSSSNSSSASSASNSSSNSSNASSASSSNSNSSNASSASNSSSNSSSASSASNSSSNSSSASSASNSSSNSSNASIASSSSSNSSSSSIASSSSSNSSSASSISSSSSNSSNASSASSSSSTNSSADTTTIFPTTTTTSTSSSSNTSAISSANTNSSSIASSAASSVQSSSPSSSATDKSSSVEPKVDKSKQAKTAMNKAQTAVKAANKQLQSKKSKKNVTKYNQAVKRYYQAEKQYLATAKLYNKRYYYDFDQVNKHSKYVKVVKAGYVHNSKQFNKQSRVKKLKKDTKIKVNKIVRHGKTTRFNIGHNQFITGLKSFIHKLK